MARHDRGYLARSESALPSVFACRKTNNTVGWSGEHLRGHATSRPLLMSKHHLYASYIGNLTLMLSHAGAHQAE